MPSENGCFFKRKNAKINYIERKMVTITWGNRDSSAEWISDVK